MSFCTHCGIQISQTDKFCPKCGKPVAGSSEMNLRPPLYFTVSLILVVAILLATFFLPIPQKGDKPAKAEIIEAQAREPRSTILPDGKLNYQKEVYVIVTGSYLNPKYVQSEMQALKERGELTGYFWRPDFPALQDQQLYSTFLGLYDTYEDCERELRLRQSTHPDYYGLRLNMNPVKVTIH